MTDGYRPRLLLVPGFTELEWGIRGELEEWAEVASFDMPGVGAQPLPEEIDARRGITPDLLPLWREGGVKGGLRVVDELDWEEFFIVTDTFGDPVAVRIARERRAAVQGLVIGHAALSHATDGERPPTNGAVWDALTQLARQGSEEFVRYGIAQMTQGGVSEDVARRMLERFPEMELVAVIIEALGADPEPIGDELAALDLPMLFAKHEGCLARTDEGFEDAVAAFPEAETVICPGACAASPVFADAIRGFCTGRSELRS